MHTVKIVINLANFVKHIMKPAVSTGQGKAIIHNILNHSQFYSWSQETAIEYMQNYTAYSLEAVTIEVNRYITWPGQACAYKLGEIRIKQMRLRAESALGNDVFVG